MTERKKAVVALGMFDGMHIGHRALIRRATELAEEIHGISAVYTFRNHPHAVLGGSIRLLSGPGDRESILETLGIDDICLAEFTKELAVLPPEAFLQLLLEKWDVRATVVGFNYTFGAKGGGTPETLRELGRRYGFTAEMLQPVLFEGEPVSSTRIRKLLCQGRVRSASLMLQRPYTLEGTVVANKRIGRTIGFPTANMDAPEERVIPRGGVYGTKARIDGGEWYPAVTNIGSNPTVHGDHLSIETHMIGFDGDVYGRNIQVAFQDWIRGEVLFSSVEELKMQIASDVHTAENMK